jgi:hypothetical protein
MQRQIGLPSLYFATTYALLEDLNGTIRWCKGPGPLRSRCHLVTVSMCSCRSLGLSRLAAKHRPEQKCKPWIASKPSANCIDGSET